MEDSIGWDLTFHMDALNKFFLNTVLFPHLPLNTVFSVAQYVHISLHPRHSACFSHLNYQEDSTSLSLSVSLYLLTTITILSPS